MFESYHANFGISGDVGRSSFGQSFEFFLRSLTLLFLFDVLLHYYYTTAILLLLYYYYTIAILLRTRRIERGVAPRTIQGRV